MRKIRLGWVLTGAVVVALIVWKPTLGGFGGALAGLLAELAALQLGLLLGALVFGVRVTHLIIGVGGEVRQWTSPRRRIVLRNIPILFTVGIAGQRPPIRLRTWLTGVTSVLLGAAAAAAGWLVQDTGVALGAAATLLHQLVPRRNATTTSVGWFVFGLPRLSGRPLAEMEAAPLINQASDAFNAGDLETAGRVTDELTERYPELLGVTGMRVMMRCGRGAYGDALHLVAGLVGRPDLQQREMAFVLASMAGLTAQAVDAGQLPGEIGLPAAKRALDGALQAGYPAHRANGTLSLLALLEGDHEKAIELGKRSAESSEQAVDRADDLTTVARAQMASGDNAKARETMIEAERLAGWYPRVANTLARLHVT